MRCPDWTLLAADDEFLRPGTGARRAALEHAADCPACRREALRLDPSLAAAGVAVDDATRAEIDAIKDGAMALCRMRRVERQSRPRRARVRLAAVACLTVLALLFAGETGDRSPDEVAPGDGPALLLSEDYRLYGSLPLVESLAPAEARVYQIGREDFSLVWIVDESIEVSSRP